MSFGAPGLIGCMLMLPVSRIHSRSCGSITTLCTERKHSVWLFMFRRFVSRFGYGSTWPLRTSPTVYSTGSPQRGMQTKMRPGFETHTPVGIGPRNSATVSMLPVLRTLESCERASCASLRFGPACALGVSLLSIEQPAAQRVSASARLATMYTNCRRMRTLLVDHLPRRPAPLLERDAAEAERPFDEPPDRLPPDRLPPDRLPFDRPPDWLREMSLLKLLGCPPLVVSW